MKNTLLKIACLMLVVSMTGACSSAGKTRMSMQKTHIISAGSTASLAITSSMRRPHTQQLVIEQRLQKELAAGLISSGVFKTVGSNTDKADYKISVDITKIRIRSPAARIIFGFIAGRSYIRAQVNVYQIKTGAVLTRFIVTGAGAKTGIGAQSYGYDDPIREVVNHVVHNLR